MTLPVAGDRPRTCPTARPTTHRLQRALAAAQALLLAGAALGGASTAAQSATGPLLDVPVAYYVEPAQIDNRRSIRELTSWRSAGENAHTVGLYRQKTRASVHLEGELMQSAYGSVVRPTRASLDIQTDHSIFVGAEFRPGTCQYEEALAHERTHEQIHMEAVEQLLPMIREAVIAQLRAAPLGRGASVQQQLQASAAAAADVATRIISDHTRALHAAFDSPHEYLRMQAACDGVMAKPVRSAALHLHQH